MADVTTFLALLTVAGQLAFLLCLYTLLDKKLTGERKILLEKFWILLKKHSLILSFLIASSATLLSLYYSEILGYEPCILCWYQRIFMYPQTFLLGMALLTKDKNYAKYLLPLSVLGALTAALHYFMQMTGWQLVGCAATGVPCIQYFSITFGYITMPLMSLTAFLLLLMLNNLQRKE